MYAKFGMDLMAKGPRLPNSIHFDVAGLPRKQTIRWRDCINNQDGNLTLCKKDLKCNKNPPIAIVVGKKKYDQEEEEEEATEYGF